MTFQAVRTTGIYCRAPCAAAPHPEHVEQFPTAVAAEAAGFRPCLRCRPERAPDAVGSGSSPAVEHALLLINEGFLDRNTEDALASRVGYSTRQLRRLFEIEVGASASFVARSRRAHFARRLLDESDLSVEAVGRAAGFSNRRQLNRTMLEIFKFTPTELRARRRAGDRLKADGGLRLRVPHEGRFDWQEMLAFTGARAIPGVERVADGRYRRVTTTCGYAGLLEVGEYDDRHIELTAHLPTFNSIIDDVARTKRLFGLLRQPATDELAGDDVIRPLLGRRPGLRVSGAWDLFETGVRIVLGQQVTLRAASTLSGRIAQRYGKPFDGPGSELTHIFPPASVLADAGVEEIGLPAARAVAIRSFARAVADESIDLGRRGSLEDITGPLEELPGIGPWTSNMMAMRVYGHPDAFPASDIGLRTAVGRLTGEGRPPAAAVEAFATRWRPHRALAAQHLWLALHDEEH